MLARSSCSVGEGARSGSVLSAALPETSARAVWPVKAVTFPPPMVPSPRPSPPSGEGVARLAELPDEEPPGTTPSLSVRERVNPFDT